jgi:hypothetical protein
MVDRMDKQTRTRVAAAGGHGRAAALTGDQRSAISATGARAMHTPTALARRIVKYWPDLSDAERAEVIGILTAGLPLRTRPIK